MNAAIINDINYCKLLRPQQFLVVGLTSDGVFPLIGVQKEFRYALVLGVKDLAGTANTGNVHLGLTNNSNEQPITIAPNDTYVLPMPPGAKGDFRDWYAVLDSDGDSLVIIYF
jgi:hypothetical protein